MAYWDLLACSYLNKEGENVNRNRGQKDLHPVSPDMGQKAKGWIGTDQGKRTVDLKGNMLGMMNSKGDEAIEKKSQTRIKRSI